MSSRRSPTIPPSRWRVRTYRAGTGSDSARLVALSATWSIRAKRKALSRPETVRSPTLALPRQVKVEQGARHSDRHGHTIDREVVGQSGQAGPLVDVGAPVGAQDSARVRLEITPSHEVDRTLTE